MAGRDMEDPEARALRYFLLLAWTLACNSKVVQGAKTIVGTPANSEEVRAGTANSNAVFNDQFGACKTNRLTIECGIKVDCVSIIGVSQCLP